MTPVDYSIFLGALVMLLCWFFKRLHVQLEEIHKCLHDMKVALTKDISALEIRVVRLETRLNNLMGDKRL
jgi:hypothetical protein